MTIDTIPTSRTKHTVRSIDPWKTTAIVMALLAPFLIYFSTARSIVSIWDSSETYAHGYIILPISLWLIWRQRHALLQMEPAPYRPALLLLAACGLGWLLAELGDVQVVRQYALIAMLPLIAVAMLGLRISWLIAFPLAFLMLAVPFGEIFIEPLIELTADFTVAALELTGIPVLREGPNFSIPSGNWSVVEACSGVRYLISSFTLGCLYAYLTYRSRWRQLAFVLASIIVPIIANGLRAYMIVMIGHLSGMELAVGFDHLIYGWVFFGLVMFLMFWIGSYWREDNPIPPNAATTAAVPAAGNAASTKQLWATAALVIFCIGIWPAYAGYASRVGANPAPVALSGFDARWPAAEAFTGWKPQFSMPAATLTRYFKNGSDQVGTMVLYYRNQHTDSKLISSVNRLTAAEDPWRRVRTASRSEQVAGRTLAVRESSLQGPSGPLLVWQWYWIDGTFTVSDYHGKLLQAKEKFLLNGDDGATVMVFAPFSENPDQARAALRRFLHDNLVPLEAVLAANRPR